MTMKRIIEISTLHDRQDYRIQPRRFRGTSTGQRRLSETNMQKISVHSKKMKIPNYNQISKKVTEKLEKKSNKSNIFNKEVTKELISRNIQMNLFRNWLQTPLVYYSMNNS